MSIPNPSERAEATGLVPGRMTRRLPRWPGLAACLLPWVIAVWAVGPFREVAKDDDWAYALTVRHLVEHHEYRLHDWATANMPAQIYWGGGFSALFGFSFTTLRFSTLTLLAVALVSIWRFLVSEGLSSFDAGILVSLIYSNPLVFLLGFSFMTDVPFMAWLGLALVGYLRALRDGSWRSMLMGSIFASAAILTRQFGIALPAALSGVLLADRRPRRLLLAGLGLPLLATVWQACSALAEPTLFMGINLEREVGYLGHFLDRPGQTLWRFARICQYVGVFSLPMAPLLIHRAWRARPPWVWVAVLGGTAVSDFALNGTQMPSLAGNLSAVFLRVPSLRPPLTLLATLVAILLGCAVYRAVAKWKALSAGNRLIAFLGTSLLALHLVYVDLIDEYLIALIPLVVLALAASFGAAPSHVKRATAALSLLALAGSAIWTFVLLERKTAFWNAAEALKRTGVPAEQIYAGEWTYYHVNDFDDLTRDFSPQRIEKSTYLVWDPLFAPYRVDDRWARIAEESYRWFDLSERRVWVYRRIGPVSGAAAPGDATRQ